MSSRLAVLVAALTGVVVSAQILPRPPAPDLILFNGKVITVDRSFSVHEAVAIIGDRILTVGNDDQMRTLAGSATRMVDLKGNAVIPGLMDNHLHSAGGGPGVDLSRARTLADVESAIKARVDASKPGDVIVSNSDWHEAQLKEQRLPLRDDLDRVAPNNPVVLVRGGHEYILNSAALTRWGIDEKTTEPDGGRITRYSGGRLNGELGDAAKSLVRLPPAPPRSTEQSIAARLADYKQLNAAGLTTVRHPGVSVAEYRTLQAMQKQGLLTMRVNALLRASVGADGVDPQLAASGISQGEGDEWLRVGGIKLAVDGGFEGGLMREAYQLPWDEGGTFKGLQTIDTERFIAAVRQLNARQWRVATHAVGDAAIDLVLNAYEKANAESSIVGRRWSIEHAFIGRPDHLPRMKALELAISAQNHLFLAGPSLVMYWGASRAALTTPVKLYLDAGLQVSSGTDAPVVPYSPLWTIYHFVTRDTISGGVMGADQRVSRQQALRMATINNAWLMMEERTKGSIEPRKYADLVILNEDPLTCPEPRLRDAKVLATIVGGRVVAGDLRLP
ncbi:MAG: amidohydrolase [Acidimicrobiia bacterium]